MSSPKPKTGSEVRVSEAIKLLKLISYQEGRSSVGFNFCPHCSHKLSPSCPKCQQMVTATHQQEFG